jgi:ketosteroid isomerase-like protein
MCMAKTLALAFGNADEMAALYDESVVWTLSEGISGDVGRAEGKDAVTAFNRYIDTVYDAATVDVEILDALEQGNTSATRFVYRANLVSSNAPYHGEYVLFVKERAGKIVEVHERTDTLKIAYTLGLVTPR